MLDDDKDLFLKRLNVPFDKRVSQTSPETQLTSRVCPLSHHDWDLSVDLALVGEVHETELDFAKGNVTKHETRVEQLKDELFPLDQPQKVLFLPLDRQLDIQ